jgi:hypothetical protein
MSATNSKEIELSDQIKTNHPIEKSNTHIEIIPLETDIKFENNQSEIKPIRSRGKELWRKASLKIMTFVRMKHFNRFINNVYYGIGIEEKEFEEAGEEEIKWVILNLFIKIHIMLF